ncbi:MAG: putative acetyltransferase [Flavobacteriales bacterium]|jgi:putative acetyltransferase
MDSKANMFGAYCDDELIGIGAIKIFADYAEIKRVYSRAGCRVAKALIISLEDPARSHNPLQLKQEVGPSQLAAIRCYEKLAYSICERFGDYKENGVSVFMEKTLLF